MLLSLPIRTDSLEKIDKTSWFSYKNTIHYIPQWNWLSSATGLTRRVSASSDRRCTSGRPYASCNGRLPQAFHPKMLRTPCPSQGLQSAGGNDTRRSRNMVTVPVMTTGEYKSLEGGSFEQVHRFEHMFIIMNNNYTELGRKCPGQPL